MAAPAPLTGPTTGGTVVSDSVPETAFTQVAGGGNSAFALDDQGQAFAWGYNYNGQLGDGTVNQGVPSNRPVPGPVTMPAGVTFTALGNGSIALGSDGNVYAWGENTYGQVGDGTTVDRPTPVPVSRANVPAGVTFTSVSKEESSSQYAIALGSDGLAYAWGDNAQGVLGDGTTTSRAEPGPVSMANVPAGVTFTAVSAGSESAYALGSDGLIYSWGGNAAGALGDGTTGAGRSEPGPVSMATMPAGVTFTDVAGGFLYALAKGSDGQVYSWGYNRNGFLGDGTTTDRLEPGPVSMASVPAGITFNSISVGYLSSYAIGSDGQIYSWGRNIEGELGDGTTTERLEPTAASMANVPAGVSFTAISATQSAAVLALGSDHRVYTWGANSAGQLGDGTTTANPLPTPITGAVTVTSVTFGSTAGTNTSTSSDGLTWSSTTPGGCGPVDVEVAFTQFGQARTVTYSNGFSYGAPPVVTTEPGSADLPAQGGMFTATAEASGDDAPAVQWQQQNSDGSWSDIPGANSTTLSTPVTATTSFRAVFTNCWVTEGAVAPTVSSSVATAQVATVTPAPTATTPTAPPTTATPGAGDLASTGASVLSWMVGAAALVLIGGATIIVLRRRLNHS